MGNCADNEEKELQNAAGFGSEMAEQLFLCVDQAYLQCV